MKKFIFLLGVFLLLPISVNAANAKIDLTSSVENNNVIVKVNVNADEAISSYEYTLDYDNSKLELVDGNPFNSEHSNNNETKSFKKEFKFKIKNSGSTEVSVISYAVSNIANKPLSVKITSTTINVNKKETTSLSDNNYLSSLEIEGYKLSPSFDKNITSYELTINDDINEINVKATADNNKAKIQGDGKKLLNNGKNKINVTVISESKDDRVYSILVILNEKNPLTVTINKNIFTILTNIESIKAPAGYKITNSKIKGKNVQVFYNEKANITLVALKDNNDKTSLYTYNASNESYTPYIQIDSDKISLVPLFTKKKITGYSYFTEVINDSEVKCLKTNADSSFCIIYGIDIKTNKKGFYSYDIDYGNIQRYNNDINKIINEKLKNTKMLIYILSATTLLFGITTIAFAIKSNKGHRS